MERTDPSQHYTGHATVRTRWSFIGSWVRLPLSLQKKPRTFPRGLISRWDLAVNVSCPCLGCLCRANRCLCPSSCRSRYRPAQRGLDLYRDPRRSPQPQRRSRCARRCLHSCRVTTRRQTRYCRDPAATTGLPLRRLRCCRCPDHAGCSGLLHRSQHWNRGRAGRRDSSCRPMCCHAAQIGQRLRIQTLRMNRSPGCCHGSERSIGSRRCRQYVVRCYHPSWTGSRLALTGPDARLLCARSAPNPCPGCGAAAPPPFRSSDLERWSPFRPSMPRPSAAASDW